MAENSNSLRTRIENDFTYHAPTERQVEKYNFLRGEARALAHEINARCPDSREKSLSLTHLEEAIFWANASIARNS